MLYENPSNISGMGGIMSYLNSVMSSGTSFDYLFSTGIVMMVFFITLIFFSTREKPEVALATSGFICTIISLLMIYAGLFGVFFFYIFIICTGIGVAYMYFNN